MASERPGLTGETPTPPDGAGAAAAADCYSLTEVVTTSQLLEDLGGYVITLWVVVGLEVLFLYGLLAKTLWSVYHNERLPKLWRSGTVWANSVPSAKFALMKFTVVIINIQKFIFSIVISTGGFTCTASMSPEVYGAFILNIVIAAEMLLFGVLNHWAYQADGRSADDLTAADLTPSGSPADRADTPTSQQTWTSTAQRENVGAKTTNGFSGA
ncbi:hypothetical protein FJT64_016010 [Amphibalanus amphitrite]|uniref:Uncharacterized protein n=1 Tax=Amphibalanus amphitrite TaxID=1232801 RepID=A0A6A4X2H2_AMPAM|nr:hypothetical protein FJT64_016010 [Amphibalanus amphitrite]KAF0313476.1 hypothetical protein FJT64_016010 [Amphibalanus amphitrite]